MTDREAAGSLKLKGKVGSERFEQTYPLKIVTTSNAGNAFVPRLFAAAKIAELERDGGDSAKPTAIALSRRFSVASRFTSLLVLESEAMFKAFGVDHSANGTPGFTGEQGAESANADGDVAVADPDSEDEIGGGGKHGKGMSEKAANKPAAARHARASADLPEGNAAPAEQANPFADGTGRMAGGVAASRGGHSSPAPEPPAAPAAAATAAPSVQAQAKEERKARDSAAPGLTSGLLRRSSARSHQVAGDESGGADGGRRQVRRQRVGIAASATWRCGGAASWR